MGFKVGSKVEKAGLSVVCRLVDYWVLALAPLLLERYQAVMLVVGLPLAPLLPALVNKVVLVGAAEPSVDRRVVVSWAPALALLLPE